MPRQRKAYTSGKSRRTYSASKARRTSRQVHDSTIGTHVARRAVPARKVDARGHAIVRQARIRRAVVAIVAVIVVVGIAVAAGVMAFRGVLGGELTLRDSDAKDALVAVRSTEPSYVVLTAELGAVAEPLETEGPDVILLCRFDSENRTLSLVNVPAGLQITSDNRSEAIASIAAGSDAAMINALSTLTKADISHIVKIESAEDVVGIVNALGGVQVNVRQAIDDPHAGNVCISEGEQTLDGKSALTLLRATNLEFGEQDKLVNQLDFAAQALAQAFSSAGNFDARLESLSPYIQTDLSLSDIESIHSWLGGIDASEVSTAVLPGYYTIVTNVTGVDEGRYISTSSDVSELFEKLESGEKMSANDGGGVDLVKPSSFTVEVQNGTTIEGAASSMAEVLKSAGFKVGDVGNSENPVFDETIVVYKSDDAQGLARAKTVIDAIGVGRAVDGDAYYDFETDVLLIIGADNKPMS